MAIYAQKRQKKNGHKFLSRYQPVGWLYPTFAGPSAQLLRLFVFVAASVLTNTKKETTTKKRTRRPYLVREEEERALLIVYSLFIHEWRMRGKTKRVDDRSTVSVEISRRSWEKTGTLPGPIDSPRVAERARPFPTTTWSRFRNVHAYFNWYKHTHTHVASASLWLALFFIFSTCLSSASTSNLDR